MKIFNHNDHDGYCSAYLIKRNYNDFSIKNYDMDYSKEPDFSQIEKDEKIYIVDFSFTIEKMKELLEITKNVIWIDHHKTAIEKLKDFLFLEGIRDIKDSASKLTWDYLTACATVEPYFVSLVDDWDNWKLKLQPHTKLFILGTKTLDISKIENWKKIENDSLKFIDAGEVIEKFRDGWALTYRKSYSFETVFEGFNCLAMNLGTCGSDYFGEDFKKYDAVLPFVFNGEKFTVSLYTDKNDIDVSDIAKKYGGGGHKKAAGFVCNELPFKKGAV